jgi:regulator of protease activity HflC (stomatin/prohibitin superfamily)
MEPVIIIELVLTAVVTIVLATVLGYLGQKLMGAAILGGGAAVASVICLAGAWAGYELGDDTGTWIGLLLGILLSGMLGALLFGGFIRSRNRRFIAGVWYAYCALCIAGHLAGGWLGLLTITLPAVIIFWIGLYRLSAYILPLREKLAEKDERDRSRRSAQHVKRGREERFQAFKSLITYSLGTNYPYYFVKDGKAEKRVEGNPAGRFFAGPGFVCTDSNYAAYVTSGIVVRGVLEPGLNFTGLFDLEPKIIDLRPQLRAFPVDALTTDGIPIHVLAFAIFQIHPGHRRADPGGAAELRKPKLGQPFPFRHRAVYDAIAGEPVERRRRKEQSGERHEWDGTLISKIATPIIQDIISRYNVDELCAAYDPDRDPRTEIIRQMERRLRRALQPYGIHLIGGAIANLEPLDQTVKERRVENWKTEWERQLLLRISEGKAERTRQIERARAAAEAEIVLRLGQVVEASASTAYASETALALRFIDCLGEMISESDTQWPLPKSVENSLKLLRGEIEEGPR